MNDSSERSVSRKLALKLGAAGLVGASALLTPRPPARATSPTAVTLSLWTTNRLYVEFFRARAKEWEKKYPQYRFTYNFRQLPYREMSDKVLAALTAGSGAPDLIGLDANAFSRFTNSGIAAKTLVDLTPRIGQQRGQFVEARWTPYMDRGRIYGVESALSLAGLYYRKDLLDAAGIKTPFATYTDLLAAGRVLAKSNTYICLAEKSQTPGFGPIVFMELFAQQGGLLFDGTGQLKLQDPRAVSSLAFLVKAANDKLLWMVPDMFGPETIAGIKAGRVASVLMPDWYGKEFIESNMPELSGKWQLQNLPTWQAGGSQVSAYGGTGFGIAKQSKYVDLAWSLLHDAYMTEPSQVKRFQLTGSFPTMKKAMTNPGVVGFDEPYFGGQQIGAVWAQVAPQIPLMYQNAYWSRALDTLSSEYAAAMSGAKTPAAAIRDASATISRAMARNA